MPSSEHSTSVISRLRFRSSLDPFVVGTCAGVFSAVGYTAANICLRAVSDCDPVWVSCVKAFPTVALVGPWVLCRVVRNQSVTPSMGALGLLAVTGMLGQLGGNVLFQWSLGVVGIALTVPLCLGAMIVSGALLGHWFLHERVSRQMVLAMAVLIVSILILSFGARAASQSVASTEFGPQTANGTLWMIAGVLTACLSGVAYCVLGVAIRHCSVRGVPISTILFTVAMLGTFGLGAMSYVRTGATAMWNTDSNDMAVMLLAGVCNAAAFLALAQALRRAGIVYINSLNASQTAMAALAGVALFGEAPTWAMMLGVLLTAVGLMLMKKDETAATTSELNEALHGPVARFADELAIPISAERSD